MPVFPCLTISTNDMGTEELFWWSVDALFSRMCFRIYLIMALSTVSDIQINALITTNDDFCSRVTRFASDFHEWPKNVVHDNECIVLFFCMLFYILSTQFRLFWLSIVMSPQMTCGTRNHLSVEIYSTCNWQKDTYSFCCTYWCGLLEKSVCLEETHIN